MPSSQNLDRSGSARWTRLSVLITGRLTAASRTRRPSTAAEPPRQPSIDPSPPSRHRAAGEPRSPSLSPMWPTLWVVSDNVRQVTPPASSTPVVLLSLKADFTDDEVRHAGVAAYAGPGSTRKDVVRCLVAAGRGRWVALRRHLPEPLRRLTPHQRVLARWLLAGEAEDAIAQGIGLDVGFVRQELLSLQALLGATSRRGLIRLLAPRPRHEEHTRPPHGPSDGW